MEKFIKMIEYAQETGATDMHLLDGRSPTYRVGRKLVVNTAIDPLNKFDLESLLEYLVGENMDLVDVFEKEKRLDIPYEYANIRLRINASLSNNVPTFSIRVIRNKEINGDKYDITDVLNVIKRFNTGLVLITGKVNSGKTTTLNTYVDHLNKEENKKIVMLEEPIEYTHRSNKSHIVQKEVGIAGDIPSYYDGVINLLREDTDIAIIGEIRDKKTMEAVLDLAEAGGLVIGTLHTRSCAETIDRIIGLYDSSEQRAIKYVLSSVLKAVISQKLILDKNEETMMVPEIMINNTTIAALIRQENFNISEIKDAVHIQSLHGSVSFEKSFAKLYNQGKVTMDNIKEAVEPEEYDLIMKMIGGAM